MWVGICCKFCHVAVYNDYLEYYLFFLSMFPITKRRIIEVLASIFIVQSLMNHKITFIEKKYLFK